MTLVHSMGIWWYGYCVLMFEFSCRGVPRRAAAWLPLRAATCHDVPQRGRRAAAAPADRSVLRRAVECCRVLQRAA